MVLMQAITQEVQVENFKSQKPQMDKIFASLNIPSYFTMSKQAQTQNPNIYASPYLTSCLLYLLVVVFYFPTPFISPDLKGSSKEQPDQAFNFAMQTNVLQGENTHRTEPMQDPVHLIVIIRSPVLSFCLSMSMCAPVHSRIALMLHPPLPITLEITVDGTETFLDLYKQETILSGKHFHGKKLWAGWSKEYCIF